MGGGLWIVVAVRLGRHGGLLRFRISVWGIWTVGCEFISRLHFVRRISCQSLLLAWWTASVSSLEEDRLWWRCMGMAPGAGIMEFEFEELGLSVAGCRWGSLWLEDEWGNMWGGVLLCLIRWGWEDTLGWECCIVGEWIIWGFRTAACPFENCMLCFCIVRCYGVECVPAL